MVKRRGQAYSDKDRESAIEMYLSGPEGYREVSKALGMSSGTLQIWVSMYRAGHPEDTR